MSDDPSPYRIRVRRGPAVAAQPPVSIIVLVLDDTSYLSRCLASLTAAGYVGGCEIIVVANGTRAADLEGLPGQAGVLIESPVNLGFAGGCNLAVQHARGERLVFLNDDATVEPGWLEGLHRALDEDEAVAIAGSRVLLEDGCLQEAGSVLWSDGSTAGVGRGGPARGGGLERRRRVDYVSFCSAMVRRAAWDQAGGFDERYFPAYCEDLDLCLVVQRAGWSVVYEPTSVVRHAEGASASRHFRDFLSRRNQRLLAAKWSAVLPDYEPPPRDRDEQPAAIARALRRVDERPLAPRSVTAEPPHRRQPIEDGDGAALIAWGLSAALAVQQDYVRELQQELAARGLLDVLRHRFHPTYTHLRSFLDARRGSIAKHRH